jgi:hypothetical protein
VTQFPQNAARGKVQDPIPTAVGSDGVQTGPETASHTTFFSETHFWHICLDSMEGGILGKPTGMYLAHLSPMPVSTSLPPFELSSCVAVLIVSCGVIISSQ